MKFEVWYGEMLLETIEADNEQEARKQMDTLNLEM